MAKQKMICAKKHFGKAGALIEVGAKSEGEPDGVYWVAADGEKSLENATPGSTAAELVKEIKESEDRERLSALAEDERKTVREAALDRIAELDENASE